MTTPKKTLVDFFIDQAKQTPDNIAVVFEHNCLTYRQLDEQTTNLAQLLRAKGIAAESMVPICFHRSLNMVIAIWGILKAGGAYVPIDPDYPSDRIEYILSDTETSILLTDTSSSNNFSGLNSNVEIVDLDSIKNLITVAPTKPLATLPDPGNLAYVIYTSGSTGRPKGVMIEHRSLLNRIIWAQSYNQLNQSDVVLQKTTYCFDVSVWELTWPFITGCKLVMAKPEGHKDNQYLKRIIEEQKVTIVHFVPSMLELFLEELKPGDCKNLEKVLCSGEALKFAQVVNFQSKLPHAELHNLYGPTEAAVDVTYWDLNKNFNPSSQIIPIGKPVANTYIHILDENNNPVADGEIGEIVIGGVQVARGYLKNAELTSKKFIADIFSTDADAKLYKTGDLGRLLADGNVEYLGRTDHQVKIRGFRIELGEIENRLLEINGIKQAVVVAKEDKRGQYLVGYIVKENANIDLEKEVLFNSLAKYLPEYMIPRLYVELDSLPLTSSGKTDRKALPEPNENALKRSAYTAPANNLETQLANIWQDILSVQKIGTDENFFELGGTSLLAQKTIVAIKDKTKKEISVTRLYQHPTIKGLAAFLSGNSTNRQKKILKKRDPQNAGVAIIGMECNFPGANSITSLWDILKKGKESITFFTSDEIDKAVPPEQKEDESYVKARGILKDVELFDASFFGIHSKLAELMDPQQRLFLELSRNVLEKTGYLSTNDNNVIGVFAGCAPNTYFNNNLIWHKQKLDTQGLFPVASVTEKDYITSRVSYQLNLGGPAVNVNSACSTGLLAVAQAVESIRRGQCNMAIAGASAVTVPVKSGHLYSEGSMLSADGHTKTFDADAKGTVFSDGAGAVLLKSLEDAERDGDTIYAVIKGIGLNNDGGGKGSFSAPSADGQATAIAMAMQDANVDAKDISYIEAHGTATPLGDPIEIEGLKLAFGETEKKQFCKIGSIKSNFGHLTHAAGVAGLIKTTLALHHKQLPPSINFKSPNPLIGFEQTPFIVQDKFEEWDNERRIAGVSSFGVGGTNVHLIVEEYVSKKQPLSVNCEGGPQVITWSARDKDSLNLYAEKLSDFLTSTDAALSDISFSLFKTRQPFNHRVAFIASSREELLKQISDQKLVEAATTELKETNRPIVFMFPGQGSQYINMGRGLYESEIVFKYAIDECAEILKPLIGEDIREVIYKDAETEADAEKLKNTFYTQPAIFITSYALAKLLMSYGVSPDAMIGHSVGEFVAAHLSGIMSLADALTIVSNRARLISKLPGGSMLSVQISAKEVEKIIPENISLAANNAPGLCVVSGTHNAVDHFAEVLAQRGIEHKKLMTSHAFHSAMMDPILQPLKSVVENAQLQIARIPILSTVTAAWLKDEEALSPDYWANHSRATVNFSDAILNTEEHLHPVFIECGPGTTATILAKRHGGQIVSRAFNSIDLKTKSADESTSFKKLLGRLWQVGVLIDFEKLFKNSTPKVLHELPTYAYNKKRHWLDAPTLAPNFSSDNVALNHTTLPENNDNVNEMQNTQTRKDFFVEKVKEILENTSGIDVNEIHPLNNFMEIGLDSLMLTQIASGLKKEFQLPITFRMLNEDLDSIDNLANYLDANSNLQIPTAKQVTPVSQNTQPVAQIPQQHFNAAAAGNDALALIAQQINLLSQQIMLMQGGVSSSKNEQQQNTSNLSPLIIPEKKSEILNDDSLAAEEKTEIKKPFGAIARIETKSEGITDKQKSFLDNLISDYNKKTAKSKAYTQQHRSYMADPRVVSGFKPTTKEMIYSLVVDKSKGCHLWDIDGNEYVDALNGFGSNFLGYQADVLKNAIFEQVEKGYEIGPQHELAGEVSRLICEMTGAERVGFCNTGSEAVLGAMRIVRTVNNKNLIVAFTGSYHGIVDEVLVRGTKKLKTFPAAPGILQGNVQNMLILDYGTDETLEIIKNRANEIAGVLVETVQSRRPEFQPVDFLKKLRQITTEKDIALIFDEVITGFRCHPGGAQAYFNIQADLATYGKVIGGGFSIGVIGGKKKYLDALDGGFWQYGDQSVPEAGVTYFAGTFVRHPLALATAKATLEYLKEQGPQLQEGINKKTEEFANRMNTVCKESGVPLYIAHFASLWKIKFSEEYPYQELLFALMRLKNIHIWDGFPCFITVAHTQDDLNRILTAFKSSLHDLINVGFIPQQKSTKPKNHFQIIDGSQPPVQGAKLGRDKNGNPAWFIKDNNNVGKYLQFSEEQSN